MKYEILQINSQLENAHGIMFARYDFIKEHFPDTETLLKLYKHVYVRMFPRLKRIYRYINKFTKRY